MLVWMLAAAMASPPSANTMATDGPYRVAGQSGHARHTHGGKAAKLSSATFKVEFEGMKLPTTLTANQVEFLTGHDCDAIPTTVRSTFAPTGLRVEELDATESSPEVSLVPGTSTVRVSFAPVDATYTHCDFFAFRVTFVAGGDTTLVATAETRVMRVTPIRRP